MGLFDRFKKQEPKDKKEAIKKPQVKVTPKARVQKPRVEKPKTEKPKIEKSKPTRFAEASARRVKKVVKKEFSQAYRILKRPIITEKTTNLGALNQYAFEIIGSANKQEIKKVIQDLFGVNVLKVNVISVPGKTRRLGRHEGWHAGYKKALITLAQGDSIEVVAR